MLIGQVHCQNEIDTSYDYEIEDVFPAQIGCSLIQNHDTSEKIIIVDSTLNDSIIGIAAFWILFDNIDSLNIESIELDAIIQKNPKYIQIRKNDNDFVFYDKRLSSIAKTQFKCRYLHRYNNSLYFINVMIYIPFAIYPSIVWQ